MDESQGLIELHYLGSAAYFSVLKKFSIIYLEAHENYQKRSGRNRCYIASANGPILLSVPLSKGKNQQMPITEVACAQEDHWQKNHWNSIQSAYGKAPFFEYYSDELKDILLSEMPRLFELNVQLLSFLIESIGLETKLEQTKAYERIVPASIVDLRNSVSIKADGFPNQRIYHQVFEEKYSFHPNLSVLDLLFCLGPETILYL